MNARSARDSVLGAIRAALGVEGSEDSRRAAVRKRLSEHPENLVPERARQDSAALLSLFTRTLEGQNATVARVNNAAEVPEALAAYLRDNNLPAEFRSGADEFLAKLPWERAPSLTRRHGRAEEGDTAALSRASGAAAETGTLFLASGPDNPTTLNFLPENHVVVIRKDDILGSYEQVWNRLREIHGPGALPRTVNLISGPSRTADIEQIIVMGAHGPKRLHVIVVG